MNKIVLVAAKESYRTADFLAAATLLRMDPVVASDSLPPLGESATQIHVDLRDPAGAAAAIVHAVPDAKAVVAVDDSGLLAATRAAETLGLAHNPLAAAASTRDKLEMRRRLAAAHIPQPAFRAAGPGEVAGAGAEVGYPAVIKPTGLSASRGVIRVDGPEAAERAEQRIRRILTSAGHDPVAPLLVEEYLPGAEVVVEGLLSGGSFETLAIIDKPDPLEGPFFEETIFTTPSRHAADTREALRALASGAAEALGLVVGPIHAEARIPEHGPPRLIEVAARTIGGLCGRSLTFGLLGESLEVLVLRAALGRIVEDTSPHRAASGVLMIPIAATGTLTGVDGVEEAKRIEGVDEVEITITPGRRIAMLPEADRYLGFVFASGPDPGFVDAALRSAAAALVVTIDGEIVESPVPPPGGASL